MPVRSACSSRCGSHIVPPNSAPDFCICDDMYTICAQMMSCATKYVCKKSYGRWSVSQAAFGAHETASARTGASKHALWKRT